MAQQKRKRTANQPEKKFGPYPGGIGVAIWLNSIDTANGPTQIRSVTVSPRRYRDEESGEWRDASSYRPTDLPALMFGLQQALEFMFTSPILGQHEKEDEEGEF